jgi:hypothetical protein
MKRTTLIGMAAVTAVLALVPLKPAYAYLDPNSAGALYQFLFPVLIAIGSAFAFLRRAILRGCAKVAHVVMAIVRGGRGKGGQEKPRAGGHVE